MDLLSLVLYIVPTAFLLSFGHCAGMCGGFVLAYSVRLNNLSKFKAFIYSLSYHLFRTLTYILLGVIAGYFSSIFAISSKFMGYIHFFIGIFLVILGIGFIKRGEILKFIENDKLWKKLFKKPTIIASKMHSLFGLMLLGFLNGFLPCGVVYTFLSMAILSKSVFMGAFIMGIFGLSTIPVMLIISSLSNLISLKFKKIALNISAFIIILFGIYNSYIGFLATS